MAESSARAVFRKLKVGGLASAVELLATLDAPDADESSFCDICRALVENWQRGSAPAAVEYVCKGLQRWAKDEAACVRAAAALRRCLHAATGASGIFYIASMLDKHGAPVAVVGAAIRHPSSLALHELALAFGDHARTDAERKLLADSGFFTVALRFSVLAGPGGTKVGGTGRGDPSCSPAAASAATALTRPPSPSPTQGLALCLCNILAEPSTGDAAHASGISGWVAQCLLGFAKDTGPREEEASPALRPSAHTRNTCVGG